MLWRAKALIQKLISYSPDPHGLNYLFQKYITRGVHLSDDHLNDKLEHCLYHTAHLKKYLGSLKDIKVLELGTGWYPIVPIGLYLCGAKQTLTYDLSPLLKTENIRTAIARMQEYQQTGKLSDYLPLALPERLEELNRISQQAATMDRQQLLDAFGIVSIVGDARYTNLAGASIDAVVSNNVLEHVNEQIMPDILREFKRILRPQGVMSHFIDMSDHFAHLDKSITIYNYLKYSPKQWARIDNSVQPQNRLRITHYERMYTILGIPVTERKDRPGSMQDLQKIKLNDLFKDLPPDQVAVSHSYVVSQLN